MYTNDRYKLRVFEKMSDRVRVAEDISDTDLFQKLLYFCELTIKIVVCGLVAGVVDGRERKQYALKHDLVRADGLGSWKAVLDEILLGPTASNLVGEIIPVKNELTKKYKQSDWQYDASNAMNNAVRLFSPDIDKIGQKVNLRRFFSDLVLLRNKTRGHGAESSEFYPIANEHIANALKLFLENFSLFDLEWVYLKQNISGKYNVIKISKTAENFNFLKTGVYHQKKEDGVYLFVGSPRSVELLLTDIELQDFFLPNGSFSGKKYELISYASGKTKKVTAEKYLLPADELPPSETRGLSGLEIMGNVFSNMPKNIRNYIRRSSLEDELNEVLFDQRHPVITLHGRGGIGKTSTALRILHDAVGKKEFELILWFSARDIDLIASGAKKVKPDVLTKTEISAEFAELVNPEERMTKGFDEVSYFRKSLTECYMEKPSIYVFDNFETLKDPIDVFNWINANVRLPNKVIITTRHRDFKGDYPIEILGMTEKESFELMDTYSKQIGIKSKLTQSAKLKLYQQSDGHPYIVKLLIGEMKNIKGVPDSKGCIASNVDVLNALFDRTYANLSSAAQRVFLTLCNWRSAIPKIALEAVLLRSEKFDVPRAIHELESYSFIEIHVADDGSEFLMIPLSASFFGKKKLSVSIHKLAVEADTQILHLLGASQSSDIKKGLLPKLENLVHQILKKKNDDSFDIEVYRPILEFIAHNYSETWLKLAELDIQLGGKDNFEIAKGNLEKYLETCNDDSNRQIAWEKMFQLCQRTDDKLGELRAIWELCTIPGIDMQTLSDGANRVNSLLKFQNHLVDTDSKRILVNDIAEKFYTRLDEADSDDCSRLGWLFMNIQRQDKAKEVCRIGLNKNPKNDYCNKLFQRLNR